jgi:hypothetical protein
MGARINLLFYEIVIIGFLVIFVMFIIDFSVRKYKGADYRIWNDWYHQEIAMTLLEFGLLILCETSGFNHWILQHYHVDDSM